MNDEMGELFKYMTQGIYVIGVSDHEHQNAFTAAWVMQVSFAPPMIVFSINPEHYSYKILRSGGICSINVLAREQYKLAEHFGKPGKDKMSVGSWRQAKTGAPVLADGLAYFDCVVSHYADAGDHKLAVCNIVDAGLLNKGIPLLYSDTGDMDGSSDLHNLPASPDR